MACFLILSALLLTGCAEGGGKAKERFLSIRAGLLAAERLELKAALTADYGRRVYDYVLTYTCEGASGLLRVEEPARIEGVEAVCEGGRVSLRYADAALDTGEVLAGVNPLQAFPLQVEAWRGGSVISCWREARDGTDCVAAEIDATGAGAAETVLCRVWFREADGAPVYSEIARDGRTVIFCRYPLG